ncbi:MAG: hypothetical protein CFK49_11405 [Armatimonadetes bacterium JP3_11]|jgi:hypothetical protein|nr:MAG: hypothetical protein CFK49_11405 [Armatimonadetes bacterium JP3_11]OYT72311.1 MAG: hypothetical protein CFK48_02950 [Armatimonadetes bacterium CP1_7O]RMH10657.1 MAG: hypothetical protein D6697_00505 [Armatimonadota bacterium]
MENPVLLAKVVGKWTVVLAGVGVGASVAGGLWHLGVGMLLGLAAIGWVVGFFVLAVRFFKPQANPLFPRLLMLSSPLKYPVLLVLAYMATRGGAMMVLGFVIGVMLPLLVVTGAAVREAVRQR